MTPQELKNSIIKLALEGKLVKGSDSSGIDLYNKIVNHKKELKIANKKHLDSNNESFPFGIPKNWKWCRFGEVVDYRMGKTPPRAESEWWTSDIPWISIADMIENGYVSNTKEKVSNSALRIKFGGNISPKGTLIMSFKLTVGRVSILNIDAVHNEAIISIFPYVDELNTFRNYLFYALPFLSQFGEAKGAIKGNTLNDTSLCNLPIPLPSFEEQKRIVTKIEELLPLVDRYEKAWSKLETFNEKFPADMEKSILHFAIHGRLSSHSESESARIFLKLLGKEECEADFELPDNWICLKLEDCGRFISGYTPKPRQLCSKGTIPYFKVADMNTKGNEKYLVNSNQFLLDESMKCFKSNTIVYPKNGGAVFTNKKRVLFRKSVVDLNTGGFEVCDLFDVEYFYLFFKTIDFKQYAKGTALPTLDMDRIKAIPTPIPPIEEQKRIVTKLEELLPLCGKLIK